MKLRRRRVLQSLGLVAVGLAGCSDTTGDGSGSPQPTVTDTDTTTPGTGTPTETNSSLPDRAEWRVETAVSPRRVVASDGVLYVGTSGLDSDKRESAALAVSPDGTVQWRTKTGQRNGTIAGVRDGEVYAISGDLTRDLLHGQNYRLHALDAADGSTSWVWAPHKSYKFFSPVGIDDRSVFVGTHDDALSDSGETLYAIDRRDGTVRWNVETGDVMAGVVTGHTVLVGDTGAVEAFLADDGESRWRYEYEEIGNQSPAVFGDLVLAGDRTVHALDVADGTERWTYGRDVTISSWLPVSETLFVGGDRIAALDRSGSERWTYDEGGHVWDAITTRDTLYAGSQQALFALDRSSGTERWRVETDADYPHPVGVVDGQYGYVTDDGTVSVVDAETGDSIWAWQSPKDIERVATVADTFVLGFDGGGLLGIRP